MSEKEGFVAKLDDVSFDSLRSEHDAGGLMDCVIGALVGKRQVARRNLSARRYCMVLALSIICGLVSSLVVLSSDESVWVGFKFSEEFSEVCVHGSTCCLFFPAWTSAH